MSTQPVATNPRWSLVAPPVALLLLALTWGRDPGVLLAVVIGVALIATVVTAVHHAEILALKVGEPFGTLILAVAVTVIEVGLIVALMVSGGDKTASLARDTVFAAIMITCNLMIGLSLVVGAARHRVQPFRIEGSSGALATVAALVTLSLVLPRFTSTTSGPTFSGPQLAFAGVASLVLYGVFVFVQTVRHRDYFLPPDTDGDDRHAAPPTTGVAQVSLGLLVTSLVAVVGLAKTVSPAIEDGVRGAGAPISFVGVVIALLVLAPETVAAVRAAQRNRMQTSLNLALGSAIASIGLTIPVIAVASIWLAGPLRLGLGNVELVLLALTVAITTLTLNQPRGTVMQGTIHLVTFAAFLFLAVSP